MNTAGGMETQTFYHMQDKIDAVSLLPLFHAMWKVGQV